MEIRKARIEDLDNILIIYEKARAFMRSYGNASQWGDNWPLQEVVIEDIELGNGYVVVDKDVIHAVFVIIFDNEPTYENIDGAWTNDEPYAVIHRIASDGLIKGALSLAVNYARQSIGHIRIDTHKDNVPMLKAIKKCGFTYCGMINLDRNDGDSSRLAFALD